MGGCRIISLFSIMFIVHYTIFQKYHIKHTWHGIQVYTGQVEPFTPCALLCCLAANPFILRNLWQDLLAAIRGERLAHCTAPPIHHITWILVEAFTVVIPVAPAELLSSTLYGAFIHGWNYPVLHDLPKYYICALIVFLNLHSK